MFCEECGFQLSDENVRYCPQCGADLDKQRNRSKTNAKKDTRLGGVVLAENEVLIRRYHAVHMILPPCNGYLSVTNKRILYNCEARDVAASRDAKEIQIDKLNGVEAYRGTNINLFSCLLGAICTLMAFYTISRVRYIGATPTIMAILLAALFFFLGIRKTFKLVVYAAQIAASPVNIGAGAFSLLGNGVLFSLFSRPTEDTDRMINELGALVSDLQTMGDMAIDEWKDC